ncbi:MAG: hypothetical protein KDA32_03800 [Phycisphaerales bacterium]|nr:hypothetical protein [Phycisphaerales bacterium]
MGGFTPAELDALRELAVSAALVGGNIARDAFHRLQNVRIKSDRSEVTDIDQAAEEAVVAHIRAARPADAFIGEEATEHARVTGVARAATDASVYWLIDPIDGTRNYIRQTPLYACAVAAMVDGRPIVGAIYDPSRDEMFAAAAGRGATRNGDTLTIDPEAAGEERSKLVVAIPSVRHVVGTELVRAVIDTSVARNLGTSALHLAWVACGRFDATILTNPKLWDIASGALIVTEAGGVCTDMAFGDRFPVDLPSYRGDETPMLAGAPTAIERLREMA